MNNERRKRLAQVIEKVTALSAVFDELRSEIEEIRDEEQEYLDNMPESLQSGERGENAQAAIDALEEALYPLEEFDADTIVSSLESASA